MRIVVDRAGCQGTGLCVALAPGVFEIDDDGAAVAPLDAVGEGDVSAVVDAIQACPAGALSLADDSTCS